MKKYRILSALSALAMAGSLLAAPFSASAEVKIPRVYRCSVGGGGYLLYDFKNQKWYSKTGDAVSVRQTDRQQIRVDGEIYTADFSEMKVYDAENKEVPLLSDYLVQIQEYVQRNLHFYIDLKSGKTIPETAEKPLYLRSIISETSETFCLAVGVSAESESVGFVYLARDYEKIREANVDADSVTVDTPEYWHIEMEVRDSGTTLATYTDTGDVNLDGKYTVADAVLTARAVAEDQTAKISELGIALADLDGDGELTVLDTAQSLRNLAYGGKTASAQLTWDALHSLCREDVKFSDFAEFAYTSPNEPGADGLPTYVYAIDNGWTLTMVDTSVLDKSKTQDDMVKSAILSAPNGNTYGFFDIAVPWDIPEQYR